ncbi:MAG: HIT family protein [Erysipelothrix sp.]|nr:HIT family protein [Erysipelothrix sp.]
MCIFCKIINKELPSEIVYENDEVIVIKDLSPITPDHSLVIPKSHAKNMIDIEPVLFMEVMRVSQAVANQHLEENNDIKGYNIIINNNSAAQQAVDHLHTHIVYRKDANEINYFSKKD